MVTPDMTTWLVGGPHHGRVVTTGGAQVLRMPYWTASTTVDPDAPQPAPSGTATYTRRKAVLFGRTFQVYVYDGMHEGRAWALLLPLIFTPDALRVLNPEVPR